MKKLVIRSESPSCRAVPTRPDATEGAHSSSSSRIFLLANRTWFSLSQDMGEIPKTITGGDTNLIFFWESHRDMNYFTSAAHPELLIATKQDSLVHMARGLPSLTDFQIS